MSEPLYQRKPGVNRLGRSWLREAIEGCWREFAGRGYKHERLVAYANGWLAFGEFVATKGDCCLEHLPLWVEPFLAQRAVPQSQIYSCRAVLRHLLRYLVLQGAISPPPPPPPAHSHTDLVDAYAQFLQSHRGLSPQSLQQMRWCCGALLVHLKDACGPVLSATTPEAILRFLTLQGQQYQRTTVATNCGIIRGFLAWLHRRGMIPRDLSGIVVSPRVFKHEQCPRYLTEAQIQAVLAVIDRHTPGGCRDYAMILLLAVYGLRGCEVRRLRLEDIDWNRQILHIRKRKAGNDSNYPLADSVAQAIITYLQKGRPISPHREVFLTLRPPFVPLSEKYHKQVRKCLGQAGITITRPGTHTFRYSCAQRLFDKGLSLKSIGDFLGHRNPDSTQRYTKIAIEQLRAVACSVGEDLL